MKRTFLTTALIALLATGVVAAKPKTPDPTISASRTNVVIGEATTIGGVFSDGAASNGRSVTLQAKPVGAKGFTNLTSKLADAAGSFSFPVTPSSITTYQVIAGKPSQKSNLLVISVRSKIGMHISDKTPRKNQRVRFAGVITPALNGAAVLIQRKSLGGAYRTVARTRAISAGEGRSAYSRRFRIGRAGVYRVSVPGTATIATGASVSRTIRVHHG